MSEFVYRFSLRNQPEVNIEDVVENEIPSIKASSVSTPELHSPTFPESERYSYGVKQPKDTDVPVTDGNLEFSITREQVTDNIIMKETRVVEYDIEEGNL